MQNLSVINNINCKHLTCIKGYVCKENVIPKLLIGEDNYHVIAPLQIICGSKNEPYATRCKLGWSIHGYSGRTHTPATRSIFYLAHSDGEVLNDLITKSFAIDSIGISPLRRENKDHIRAVDILDKSFRKVNEQYEVCLPFKSDEFILPDSYDNALSRMISLNKKFNNNRDYANRYSREIKKFFDEGYAREIKGSEQSSGPDLYNSLFGIMLRFRTHPVVIIGDIKDMFLRIKISPDNQHVFRFLWKDPDAGDDAPIKVCVMQCLIFGATCSPFIAQYVKNKNASMYEDLYPEAVKVILNNHYMDDCLHSTTSIGEAIELIKNITEIHGHAGFNMRSWTSNSKQVIDCLPNESLANSAIQLKDGATDVVERTLGLMWHPSDDTFLFNISFNRLSDNVLNGSEPPTKAKMLSLIMSVYDMQGFITPITIKGKIILQNVHRSGVGWNCPIHIKDYECFLKWLNDLKVLAQLRIPRWYNNTGTWSDCYPQTESGDPDRIINTEMHIFCDASLKAYAAVVYWRFIRTDGKVFVCFVTSKSRVSPLRPLSVPRLELQAALLAARLASTVRTEHTDITPTRRYFWTDSKTVLQWIRSDPRTFKPYVAHRLGEIDELTRVIEWRYVPTGLNAADVATREDAPPLTIDNQWFQGPAYLRLPEVSWPADLCSSEEIYDEVACEQRSVNTISASAPTDLASCLPDEERFSSWKRLLRSTARVLMFVDRCRRRNVTFNVDLMSRAEELLLKKIQSDSFSLEIDSFKQKKSVSKNSRLLKLTPYLDERHILRVGGRVDKADGVSYNACRPVIVDGRHKITQLIVEDYHRRALHGANEMVVNEIRQKYWVIRLRPTVRGVAARCLFCRHRRAAPHEQRMADLPQVRPQHHRRPFSSAGVDFFGPMEITSGRKRVKQYGVLFTCLTIRAVHIELSESLSTDATIMALRRMIARRGTPEILYSDNGTNFRGADAELKRSLQELNFDRLQDDGLVRGIKWRFIPPGAPEMGGAWERLVRSVKTALKVVLKERAPHFDTLSTLMCEVEALINSRPITHVSTDPNYPEALTPNHFLIGTSSSGTPYGKYDNGDLCNLGKRWRVAQRLTDMFWSRWLKEYLPSLLPRQKWNSEAKALSVGDYVLVVDPQLERGSWRHGVVSAAHAGEDGRVRCVDVRTRTGVLKRPVTRLALLEV
ncbi:PREDICTED: uncharacterized protein LOC106120362 [Papilio xuthus]|uniref:Uncharacterized protein LOC106120362 n=1 Tax=Papilio xuthus TaxID=66420 RepID=A0AAJ7EBZ0_PAPXU|nr:PREDICTED: uncharacterized protein LOC106120362 [Papilio xuthus]